MSHPRPQDSPRPSSHAIAQLSVQKAAAAVLRLINEKPSTPTVDEISALIGTSGGDFRISDAAEAIAETYRLQTALEKGQFHREKLPPPDGKRVHVDFEGYVNDICHDRRALEELVLDLEPKTIGELLSLVLVTLDAFENFASADYDKIAERDREREIRTIERALQATVRWVVHHGGATSPLLSDYFVEFALPPRDEQMATALARARELEARASAPEV